MHSALCGPLKTLFSNTQVALCMSTGELIHGTIVYVHRYCPPRRFKQHVDDRSRFYARTKETARRSARLSGDVLNNSLWLKSSARVEAAYIPYIYTLFGEYWSYRSALGFWIVSARSFLPFPSIAMFLVVIENRRPATPRTTLVIFGGASHRTPNI